MNVFKDSKTHGLHRQHCLSISRVCSLRAGWPTDLHIRNRNENACVMKTIKQMFEQRVHSWAKSVGGWEVDVCAIDAET